MKFLSETDLVGSIVPKPYINKITIESAGYNRPPKRSNPHVQPRNSTGNISETVPGLVESPRESGMQATPKPSTVTLDLVVKDIVRNTPSLQSMSLVPKGPTASDKLEVADYIRINVVQCTDAKMSNAIIAMSKDTKPGTLLTKVRSLNPKIVTQTLKEVSNASFVANWSQGTPETIVGSQGSLRVKDIPYRIKFEDDLNGNPIPFQPNYLAYFVWTEFDLECIAKDFDFEVSDLDGITPLLQSVNLRSSITYDKVIVNGETIERAFIFRTDDGAIWTGNATEIGGGKWWTGRWSREDGESITHADALDFGLFKASDGQMKISEFGAGNQADELLEVIVTRELVKKEIVRNTKIQDFRAVERLEKINLDFSFVENHLTNNVLKTSRMLSTFMTGVGDKTKKYFSDMYLTRDTDNNCRFFFGLRKDKILQDFSPLRALFRSRGGSELNAILSYSPIISMKVYRVRVKGSPEIGSQPTRRHRPYSFGTANPLKFNNQNEYQGSSGISGWKTSDPQNTNRNLLTSEGDELIIKYAGPGAVEAIDGGSGVTEISNIFTKDSLDNVNVDDLGVTYFTGVDKTIKHKTDGYYQYKIVLEIKDGAAEYLAQINKTIKDTQEMLLVYFTKASELGSPGVKNFADNPHIDNENATLQSQGATRIPFVPGDMKPGNFDPALNRFTRNFVSYATTAKIIPNSGNPPKTSPPWPTGQGAPALWDIVVGNYIAVVNKLGGNILAGSDSMETLREALTNYIRPQTGNLQGIIAVLKLLENFENIISRAIKGLQRTPSLAGRDPTYTGTNNSKKVSGGQIVASNIEGQKPAHIKSISVENQFDSTFNANLPDNVGLDIFELNAIPEERLGIREITGDEFLSVVKDEKQKIFKNADGAALVPVTMEQEQKYAYNLNETDYSYFTPNIVKTPLKKISLRPINNEPPAESVPPNSLIATTNDIRRKMETATNISSPLSSLVSEYNLTVVAPREPKLPIVPMGQKRPSDKDQFDDKGKNESYVTRLSDHAAVQRNSTDIFSELSSHICFPTDINNVGKIAIRKSKKNLNSYKKDTPNGYFSNIVEKQNKEKSSFGRGYTEISVNTPALVKNGDVEDFNKLPNHVKAFFTLANGGNTGTEVIAQTGQIFTNDVENLFRDGFWSGLTEKSKTQYKFESIYTLEYFQGWKNITEGFVSDSADQISLIEKDWAPFDRAVFDLAGGNEKLLLCRFKKYSNTEVGIEDKNQLPLFEQFFILNPASVTTTITATVAPPIMTRFAPATPAAEITQIAQDGIEQYIQTNNKLENISTPLLTVGQDVGIDGGEQLGMETEEGGVGGTLDMTPVGGDVGPFGGGGTTY